MCPNGVGILTCGEASLLGAPITGYIQELIRTKIDKNCDVEVIPNLLIQYFNKLSTVPDTNFIVAGYKATNEKKEQRIFKVNVKTQKVEMVETASQGTTWDGETLTLTRLLQPFVKSRIVTWKSHKYIL